MEWRLQIFGWYSLLTFLFTRPTTLRGDKNEDNNSETKIVKDQTDTQPHSKSCFLKVFE